jgi:hypothetical protein
MKNIEGSVNLPDDLSTLDMDHIEETILGIFRSNEFGERKNLDLSKLNHFEFDDEIDQSDNMKKVFETIKEPKNKKKLNKRLGDDIDLNGLNGLASLLSNSSEDFVNQLLGTNSIDNTLLLDNLKTKSNNIIGDNILQNIIGTDYNTPILASNLFNMPQINIPIPNIPLINHNNQSNNSSTNLLTVEDENSMNNLSKLQSLQNLADIWKLLNDCNQAGDIINDEIPKTELIHDNNLYQDISMKVLQELVNKQPPIQLQTFNNFQTSLFQQSEQNINHNFNLPIIDEQVMGILNHMMQNQIGNISQYTVTNLRENYLNSFNILGGFYNPSVKKEENK